MSERVTITLTGGTAEEREAIRQRLESSEQLPEFMFSDAADNPTDGQMVDRRGPSSTRRLQHLADALPAHLSYIDGQERYRFVNRAYLNSFCCSEEELVGRSAAEVLGKETYAATRRNLQDALAGRQVRQDEELRLPQAGTRQFDVSYVPDFREDGSVSGCFVLSVDVTERKKVEKALGEAHGLLEAMTETIPDPIYAKDSRGRMLLANRATLRVLGKSLHEILGKTDAEWLREHPEEAAAIIKNDQLVMTSHRAQLLEEWLPTSDGPRLFRSTKAPLKNVDGAVVGVVGVSRDITEERSRERALEESERRLREADERKNEFLAMLGHELRNPLAAVRHAAEVLEAQSSRDPRLSRTHAILERQTAHMARLLDGLLDVSRIVRGRIALDRQKVDLVTIARQLASDFADSLSERELGLHAIFPDEPIWLDGDPVRLTQIIDNLLSNSCRYTPAGGSIRLEARTEGEMAVVTVSDTGIGIDAELIPHIFEVFRQSEQSLDRSYGGLGLGLALVKALTELHGGTVEAMSAGKGKGTTFVVQLPRSSKVTLESSPSQSPLPTVYESLRILLIEDNQDAAEMLSEVLQFAGHEVHIAGHGARGVELATQLMPDIVLCDLGLPGGMTGFDVAQALRADDRTRSLLLVALTGYGTPDDRLDGASVGFDAHLTKPVDLVRLNRTFADLGLARD